MLMKRRINHKNICCQKIQEKNSRSNIKTAVKSLADRVFVMQEYSLVWCPVFKAASTNWMKNIVHLANLGEMGEHALQKKYLNQENQQARHVAPKFNSEKLEIVSQNKKAKKMMIVRHPFERLVSAFRDKLERCTTTYDCTKKKDWYYSKHGSIIVKKYRKIAKSKFGKEFFSKK